eukprot:TRINITY_DN3282_c1_g1_i4.p1 TRINITY_DN3282_c1_g1~~TRINITY_DN3282_c1_g1_i4.p1  ORF type:complete len:698 (-),score=152.26 TRINITY_DN3282_c1_g1_i4:12-2105(-)
MIVRLVVSLLVLSATPGAICFDTGHHYDLLRSSLTEFGFKDETIKIMQAVNWFADLYSFGSPIPIPMLEYLHVDTLRSTDDALCYWSTLITNTQHAVQNVTMNRSPIDVVYLLSATLHAVQDFYSHSNWVESHPHDDACDCYRSDTFFHYFQNPAYNWSQLPEIYSDSCPSQCPKMSYRNQDWMTPHGDYCQGINKDSIVRPNFNEAYVFAYVASLEWINATMTWINEADPTGTFWDAVRTCTAVDASTDLEAAFKVSLWTMTGTVNMGHWKGSGSGSTLRGLVAYILWMAAPNSQLVESFRSDNINDLMLSPSPYECSSYPQDAPRIYPYKPNVTLSVVVLRTLAMHKYDDDNHRMYGVVYVGAGGGKRNDTTNSTVPLPQQVFIEPTQISGRKFPYWTTMRFLSSEDFPIGNEFIPINYQLWNENVFYEDTLVDIVPVNASTSPVGNNTLPDPKAFPPGTIELTYWPYNKIINGPGVDGVYSNASNSITVSGPEGYVTIYIDTRTISLNCSLNLTDPPLSLHTPPQCPNTASGENGPALVCTPAGADQAMAEFRSALAELLAPLGTFLLLLIVGPIIWCRRRHRACFAPDGKCHCYAPWTCWRVHQQRKKLGRRTINDDDDDEDDSNNHETSSLLGESSSRPITRGQSKRVTFDKSPEFRRESSSPMYSPNDQGYYNHPTETPSPTEIRTDTNIV